LRRFGFLTAITTLLATGLFSALPAPPALASRAVPLAASGAAPPIGWTKTVTPPIAAELVGAQWEGSSAGAVDVRVQNADGWSGWQRLEGNPDEGPDPGSHERRAWTTAGPAWTGRGIEKIQVKVAEGRLPGLRLQVVHSPAAGGRQASIPLADASPAQPGIISRAQWGADESYRTIGNGCNGQPEYASSVRNAFVHHTVNINTYAASDSAAIVRGIYYMHTHSDGWCDIGYNFLVDRFGQVFEGRYGGITKAVIGAQAGGFNTGSTGVALIGQFQPGADPPVGTPSAAMTDALTKLLAWKLAYHGVDPRALVTVVSSGSTRYPAGQAVTLNTISGHRDVSQTSCPGDNEYTKLTSLRDNVMATILATPPTPLPGWVPVSSQPKLFALNGYGGLQPAGGQAAVAHSAYWPGNNIVRGAVGEGSGGGWVLDSWGGIHEFGNAPHVTGSGYWPGSDVARAIVHAAVPNSGYVLDWWGGIHPFGSAPPLMASAYFKGHDIARAIALTTDGLGGYVLDGWGGVHTVGAAPAVTTTAYWSGWDIARAIALRPDGKSGYVLDGWGGLHPFGGAPSMAVSRYVQRDEMRGLVLTADGTGGYVEDVNGMLWPVGSAPWVKHSGSWTGAGIGRGVVLLRSTTQ
jgi:hypothetical protein